MSAIILLGFDYGRKRIGIAIGNSHTKLARGLTTLNNPSSGPNWHELDKLIETWQPDTLVVGLPLNMDQTENNLTKTAKSFGDQLNERYNLPVNMVDERLSTVAAKQELASAGYKLNQKNRAAVDQQAARIILQTYLEDGLSSHP